MLQVTFGLLLVLAMIAGLAWAVAKLGRFKPLTHATLRMVASVSVGPRERVAVVEVGGQWLVLGVAPGSVNLLDKTTPQGAGGADPARMADDADAGMPMSPISPIPPLPPFAAWLQRALNRKQGS